MTIPRAGYERTRAGDTFETLHGGLTVELISTHRDDLMTCSLDDSLADVVMHNTKHYDYLPVTAEQGGRIVGLLHAAGFADRSSAEGRVREHCCPQLEEHLIGADASILDFVKEADCRPCRPCRLVVSGTGIVGLVTLSDLQKLPVRAALFALVTGLEISMSEAIKRNFPTRRDWLRLLSQEQQKDIRKKIQKSKDRDGFVDDVLFTQFYDKAIILTSLRGFSSGRCERLRELQEIKELRNKLAHANDYAATPDAQRKVCAVVRNLLEIREEIENVRTIDAAPAPDAERLGRLRQAAHDPLFLADLKDAMEPSVQADSEWWEPGR